MNTNEPSAQTSPSSRSSGSSGDIGKRCLLQPNTILSPLDIRSSIRNILSTRLSADQLQADFDQLELLKKSSFYIMVLQEDSLRPDNPDYISSSVFMPYIDMSRFERVKRDGTDQVTLQLDLLEILHSELAQGRQELEEILDGKGKQRRFTFTEIKKKIFRLCEVADDFDDVLNPGKLFIKHCLITELESRDLPEFQLVIKALRPVLFNRKKSKAFGNTVKIYWCTNEEDQYKPDEKFEFCYKLLNPKDMMEARLFGCVSCPTFGVKLTNLIPDKSYRFSVKRVDNPSLVYRAWNDTVVLTTTLPHAGS